MIIYAAALAAMFICQNGLTGVIQAPPRRPRAPRKAASRGPVPKTGARAPSDDDGIARLDLRENPLLAVIPSGALTGLRALEEVLLPVDVAYVAPDAFAPGVAIPSPNRHPSSAIL